MAGAAVLLAVHMALARLHWLEGAFHGDADTVVRQVAVSVWLPALAVVAGLLIGVMRPLHPPARVASALFLGFSLVLVDLPDGMARGVARTLRSLSGASSLAVPALTLWFALVFPSRAPLDRRWPWLRTAAVFGSAAWWAAVAIQTAGLQRQLARPLAWGTFAWCTALYALAVSVLLGTAGREMRPDHRHRLRLVAVGTAIGLAALGILATVARLGQGHAWLTALLALAMSAFPASFVYAVVRHSVFDIDVIVRRSLQYLLLSRGVYGLQGLVMVVLGLYAWRAIKRLDPWALLFVIMVASLVEATLKGLVAQLMPAIDRRFFREAYDARRILLDVGDDARRLASRPQELLATFAQRIRDAVHPSSVEMLPAGSAPPDRLLLRLATREHEHGVIALGDKLSEEPWSREDRELLDGAAHQVAVALDNARLFAELAAQERMRHEMEIAREVQQQLFPRGFPSMAGLDCAGECRPALGVGGDYYDVLALGPGRVGLALGDVSGKGISAALLMARLQALLRSHAPLHPLDPPAVLAAVNRFMCESSDGARYATLFYGVFDAATGELAYVNAGHNPPLLLREGAVERLTEGGLVVGLLPDAIYTLGTVRLEPGDTVVLYSDGITEAESPAGDMFGEPRLLDLLEHHRGDRPDLLRDALLDAAVKFADDTPLRDDCTVLVATRAFSARNTV